MKASDSERFPTERRITRALELRTMLNTAILSHPFGDPVWRGNKVKKKSFSLWKIFKIYKCRKVLDAETEFSHDHMIFQKSFYNADLELKKHFLLSVLKNVVFLNVKVFTVHFK